ncbi:hypothetical protein OZN62_13510 [Aurantiacibacter sp. MUD11]|uniref:hypothetical protein n=1 Tax=Aurantiacibacter sp. MUD11 TaxID=3003265 RepID=UPI0022A9F6D7|nr:hypothetical protein [Aurantiacibacter sp. MUD11]WAT17914.1 hypothetical protein OZN62_13510 [Aurantiacibacter sp. MUD11]
MQLRHVMSLGLAALALAACNSSEEVEETEEVAQPEPVLTPAPQATTAPDGTALVPGSWIVNENAQGAMAMFGEANTEPSLTIDCEAATGTVTMTLSIDASGPEAWRLDAGGEAARIDMAPVEGPLPLLGAEIEPSLAIFHAFSNPDEVVTLTAPTGERWQYPTHPGISRVLYACS